MQLSDESVTNCHQLKLVVADNRLQVLDLRAVCFYIKENEIRKQNYYNQKKKRKMIIVL